MQSSKKVLFVATVVKKHINVFHLPYLKWFQDQGYETHVAARDDFNGDECYIPHCDNHYDIPFERSPLKFNNFKAYKQLKTIINKNDYDIIHCHTPVAAMLTRFAAISSRKKRTRVIYTAHGFHFFKGSPILNWLVFFPIEYICSFFTDVIITINKEDYHLAKKIMKAKEIEYIPGIGINVEKFKNMNINRQLKRNELNIPENATLLLSVGELSKRKNHQVIIDALYILNNSNVHYCIVGEGGLEKELRAKVEYLQIQNQVHFLGFRNDIPELCKISDIFVFPSLQEGLPVSLMEAMATGLPCVISDIRGNKDLIENYKGGILCEKENHIAFCQSINEIITNRAIKERMIYTNLETIKKFDYKMVHAEMKRIYSLYK